MEATEIAETIHGHHEAHGAHADETFRKLTAIYVGIIAMLLAITALGGSHATKVMLNANNIADTRYITTCSGTTGCFYGQSRLITLTMRYQW